jgi:hypothetical protein
MFRTLLALITYILLTAPATAEEYNKFVKLVHVDTGKVLAVADNSDEADAKAVLAKDDGSKGQHWKIDKDDDHYKLANRKSGKILDVFMGSQDEGSAVIQWHEKESPADNQRWSWEGVGKERRLKSKVSNLVLDVDDKEVVIQKKSYDKAKSQLWRVVLVD